jgi:signal transduction histidine kinase/FixJ family two-component response regulator
MITLKEWFYRKARFPILSTVILMALSLVAYLWFWQKTQRHTQDERTRQIVGLASLAIIQKDRTLLESSLRVGFASLRARKITLCENDTVLISHPTVETSCAPKSAAFTTRLIQIAAVGMPRYRFNFYLPAFPDLKSFGFILLLSGVFLAGGTFLLVRLYRRFKTELLQPLLAHLSREEPFDIRELEDLRRSNMELAQLREQEAVTKALYERSEQIAHDIRSPITSLDAALNMIQNIPERPRRILRHVSNRVHDLADTLLRDSQPGAKGESSHREELQTELLVPIVEALIIEKRIQYQDKNGVEIEMVFEIPYGTFAKIERSEMNRVLSNLIDNAVEAIPDNGKVSISLRTQGEDVELEVLDSGRGIAPDVLPRLMNKGETFGKKEGRGLGLYLSRRTIERWGGKIRIESELGRGTKISIQFPVSPPASWFIPQIQIASGTKVIILDDDRTIHEVWDARFSEIVGQEMKGLEIEHYYEASALSAESQAIHALFLIDYELPGSKVTGLELIEQLGIQHKSVLVTGRYDDPRIIQRASSKGVPILPKEAVLTIPIEIVQECSHLDGVLIDDDPVIREIWTDAAERCGRRIWTFSTPGEFLAARASISPEVPIYVDAKLGSSDGQDLAATVHELGYLHIAITTALPSSAVRNQNWMSEIRGKEPPWNPFQRGSYSLK